jgi:hypothetical protein
MSGADLFMPSSKSSLRSTNTGSRTAHARRGTTWPARLTVTEWVAAALLSLLAIVMHAVVLTHAGALWRDEASTVWLATRPSLADVWQWLPYDHCPPVIHAAIRAWWALGLAESDLQLRGLGFALGMLQLGACWLAAWLTRKGPPVLLLALVAVNGTLVTVGDSFRGYGLGATFAMLVAASTWRVVQRPGLASAVFAAVVAVASVQSLYQAAIFVFAACSGAIVVCLVRRRWSAAIWPLGVGVAAAASMLPYVEIVRRAQDWYALEKAGFQWTVGWANLVAAAGGPLSSVAWLCVALCALTVAVSLRVLIRRAGAARSGDADSGDLDIFAGVGFLVALAVFAAFLKVAGLPTQPWYYTSLVAFSAVCLDAVVPRVNRWARAAVVLVAVSVGGATLAWGLGPLETRQTNVDAIAARVAADASEADFVIVHPWYCGATFARYYAGRAPWSTLPPLSDHFLHRYDLLKVEMQKPRPIDEVLQRVAATLRSGRRVWLVGFVPLDGTPPPAIGPAPDNPWGWFDEPYSAVWGMQLGYVLASHATSAGMVMRPEPGGVSAYENLPLVVLSGWR